MKVRGFVLTCAKMRVLLLLPTSSYRARDFLEAARRLGVEVVVASEETSTMESLQSQRLVTLDFLDPLSAAERVARFHDGQPLDAVVSVDEDTAVVAASVAARLGLPHHSAEAAERARLKHRMRESLAAADVGSPRHRLVATSADPGALARELDYPVVVKPVFLSGSRGVVRADDPEAFVAAFERVRRILDDEELRRRGGEHAGHLLVEAFVPGDEVAVEALLTDGRLSPLAIFDKPEPLEGPYFEESIYVTPSRHSMATQEAVLDVTARAAAAIGLRHGPIHAELRLPPGGSRSPSVIEVAGRSIGGLCSRTLRFGIGQTLEELILEHAMGRSMENVGRESRAAGVMMIPIPRAGRLEEIRGADEAERISDIEEVTITATLGQELVPLPEGSSYLGFIFSRAGTPERAEAALREAHARLRFVVT